MSAYIDACRKGWPISPDCSHVISFGAYSALAVFGLIVLFLPRTINYRAIGTLPFAFFAAVVSQAMMVALALSYTIYIFYIHSYSTLLLAYCISRIIFWAINMCQLIKWRDLGYLPMSLAISFSVASIIELIPLTGWATYFSSTSYKNGEFVFYVAESGLVATIFVSTMIMSTRRTEAQSAWTGFSKKTSRMLPFIWPKKSSQLQSTVIGCLVLLLFGRMINLALPLYSKWIVDGLSEPGKFDYNLIYVSTLLKFMQGNGAMGGFLNTLRSYMWIPIQQYTTRELEVELFNHLHSLSLRWHLSRKTGLVLRVMDRGTSSVNSILNYVLFNILPTIADILIAVVFFFSTYNLYFGVIVFVTMFLYLVGTIYVTEWRTKFIREMNDKDNASSAIGTDSLLNYETVKYYGNEVYEVDRFKNAILAFQAAEWMSNASLAALNFMQNGIIGLGLLAGSLLVAQMIVLEHTLTVGDYVMFTTYILQLYTPLNFFGTVYRVIQKSFIDMENMFDLMNEQPEVFDYPNAIEYSPTGGRISVKNLSFSYNEGHPVLQNISFEVGSGQSVAVVGPSGSGKSTIIRLLFRLFDSEEGSICFDGHPVQKFTLNSLRRQIGIVPQDTVLFNDTIRYNIRFGRPTATDEEVIDAAKAAMIHDKIMSLPDAYETMVGERGLKLSGGEKQRVAIARTILKMPQFIFLDEATSALDTHTERAIQRCLEQLCSTRTGVVVAHRLSTVVNADCIIVLDKGVIVEKGNHAELLAAGGVYYHMWESQNADKKSDENGSKSSASEDEILIEP